MLTKAFANRPINLLNLHAGLRHFAEALGPAFVGIYLFSTGLTLPAVFLAWAAVFLVRFCLRPLSMRLLFRYGFKRILLLGTFCFSVFYVFLAQVQGVDIWLFLFILVAAAIDVLYWLPYHTYFALLGDLDARGKQLGIREAIVYLMGFLAPLTGGVLIQYFNFDAMFLVAGALMPFAAIPLFKAPKVPLPEQWKFAKVWKMVKKTGALLYAFDGFYYHAHIFVWLLVLLMTVGNYISFGGLLSLVVLFQMLASFFIGHLFDNGNGKKTYIVGLFLVMLVIIGRTFLQLTIPLIIFLDVLLALGLSLYQVIMNSAFYNLSKKSPHPLWFQFFAEVGWDIGSSTALVSAAIFLHFGVESRLIMLMGIFGLLGIGWFLRGYFRES